MAKLTIKTPLSLETRVKLYQKTRYIQKAEKSPFVHTHMCKKLNKSNGQGKTKAYLEKIKDMLVYLEETYPGVFNRRDPKPLKRRIIYDLLEGFPLGEERTKTLLRKSLKYYTNNVLYLNSILIQSHRYDLEGREIEEISEGQKDYTRAKLNQIKLKKDQKNKK